MNTPWKKEVIIGDARLLLGDCLEILPTLEKVDAVITDPPYGIGIAANPFRQKHEVMQWDNAPADLSWLPSLAVPSVVWGGNYFALPPSQGFLIWDKEQPADFSSAQVEFAWSNIAKPAKLFRRHVVSYTKHHPTTKPLELMIWCIEWAGKQETILDAYMGSGSTGVACMNLGRRFVGIEIEEKYFNIAVERITNAQRQTRLFDEPKAKPTQEELL